MASGQPAACGPGTLAAFVPDLERSQDPEFQLSCVVPSGRSFPQNDPGRSLAKGRTGGRRGGGPDRPASAPLEEARHMTGTIHVADVDGDTTRTWDTADP